MIKPRRTRFTNAAKATTGRNPKTPSNKRNAKVFSQPRNGKGTLRQPKNNLRVYFQWNKFFSGCPGLIWSVKKGSRRSFVLGVCFGFGAVVAFFAAFVSLAKEKWMRVPRPDPARVMFFFPLGVLPFGAHLLSRSRSARASK